MVFFFALRALWREGLSISGVVVPLCGGVLLAAAAVGLRRLMPNSSALALIIWVVLGVLPSGVPFWLGLVVLLALAPAARGSYVLRRLN